MDKVKGSPDEAEKLTTPTSDVEKGTMKELDEDEKEVPEQSKLLESNIEVKFIKGADSQNGDAKVDIDNVRVVFSGMGKEELMKFANDPFWVRLRWFLFILFWLVWIGMLAGAIAIIFIAPKCPAAAPREWWEKGPLLTIDVDNFSEDGSDRSGTLQGLTNGLDTLSKLGVKGLLLSSILRVEEGATERNAGIVDFKDVNPRYGTLEDFKAFSAKAKQKDMKLMLTVSPNHSSRKHPWFVSSLNKEEPYSDYYLWVNGKSSTTPPNNWLSMNGGSAWEWTPERSQFYLHQFAKDQPDFNFRNPAVIAAFKDVFSFWRGLGVSGFRIDGASYLLEDKNLKDDPQASAGDQEPGSTHTDYGFYRHIYTSDLPETVTLLAKLKQPLLADENEKGILAADIAGMSDTLTQYYGVEEGAEPPSQIIVELPLFDMSKNLKSPASLTAAQLQFAIQQWLAIVPNNTWPNWLLPDGLVSKELEGGFNMAMLLIEGTPITSYAASVPSGVNVSEIAEHRDLMHGLSLARESPSILYGSANITVIDNNVLAYTRMKSGNPGYLVLFNLGDTDREVNAKIFPTVPDEVSVQLRSPGFKDDTVQEKAKLPSERISVPSKSALVLTFVPQKH